MARFLDSLVESITSTDACVIWRAPRLPCPALATSMGLARGLAIGSRGGRPKVNPRRGDGSTVVEVIHVLLGQPLATAWRVAFFPALRAIFGPAFVVAVTFLWPVVMVAEVCSATVCAAALCCCSLEAGRRDQGAVNCTLTGQQRE